jgi:hypothetical protein
MLQSKTIKIFFLLAFVAASVIGFMVKLPSAFRQIDKELHTLFYFLAAAFLNILFANRNLLWHMVLFIGLFLFGVAIEFAQEYSNTFLHRRIHGRFDIEDVKSNTKGLIAFSGIWIMYVMLTLKKKQSIESVSS